MDGFLKLFKMSRESSRLIGWDSSVEETGLVAV
jgi:hypothetical protein